MLQRIGIGWLLLVVAFLYLPIAIMMLMAFNSSPFYTLPIEFTGRWFSELAHNDRLLNAGWNSIWVAVVTSLASTLFGTAAALALARRRFRGRRTLQLMLLPPMAIPWLIIGTAMLVFFYWSGIGRGLHAMILGHVALALPYVILVVGTGVQTLKPDIEEAAMSLGSTPVHAFYAIALPLLAPSIVAAGLFAFAVSLDQFVISYFLATPGVTTLPVEIYSSIRKGFTPEINAVSTILLGVSMILVLSFAWLSNVGRPRERR